MDDSVSYLINHCCGDRGPSVKLFILWVWYQDEDFPDTLHKTLDSIHDTWTGAFDHSKKVDGKEFDIEVRELRIRS